MTGRHLPTADTGPTDTEKKADRTGNFKDKRGKPTETHFFQMVNNSIFYWANFAPLIFKKIK